MKKIKVGIWGLGRAGYCMHISEIAKFPDMFEIVAGCDIAKDRVKAAKEKVPSCRFYSRQEEFLKDPEVELVSVATRSPDHTAHALKALAAGKYVFLEKPVALTYADAKKLKKASEKYPGKLFLRHNRRFEAPFNHIREIIASGVLGEVYEVKLHRHGYQRRNDWQTIIACGGGQLNNWGPHIIDHALRFLESPVAKVCSDLKKIAAVGDAEDHLKIVLTGKNGRIVDLEISGGVAIPQPEYIIFGTKGALTCQGNTITMRYIDPKQKFLKIKAYPDNPPLNGVFGNEEVLKWVEKTVAVAPKSKCDTHDIWQALYNTIRKGKPYPITIDEGMEVVRITELVKKGSEFAAKG
ncbi:MAG: Gfo/Idh/MocA family oxidoreductase [Victivallaceae bacterium]|jgi:predicted dehydrogenase